MMTVTPNCKVVYKNRLYFAGEKFEIDDSDAKELSQYGTVEKVRSVQKDNEQLEGKPERKPRKKIEIMEVGDENERKSNSDYNATPDRGNE